MNTLSSGYRPFIWEWWKHYLSPSTYYYYVKYKWQRAQRGWADCDTWSLDNYLIDWLPEALQHLKDSKHGTPMSVFPRGSEFIDEYGNPNEKASQIAEKKWDEIMNKMILGFATKRQMDAMSYESEIGPYPDIDKMFQDGESWITDEQRAWFDKMRPLEERDQAIFEEGLDLFCEHFESLWD